MTAAITKGAPLGFIGLGVVGAAQALLLCLPDTPDVERVLFGEQGAIHGLGKDAVVIDCMLFEELSGIKR